MRGLRQSEKHPKHEKLEREAQSSMMLTLAQPGVAVLRAASENVLARQNRNRFSNREIAAVSRDVQEAITFCDGSKIAGALPVQRFYDWRGIGPLKASRPKVGEAGFFVERFAEARFEKCERTGFLASKKADSE
jgi:hypothetical protein